ncbi:MAG: TetR/AcrR family transcriptional regulator [Pseudomonadales bacterium]
MVPTGLRKPTQSRSEETLKRILQAGTSLVAERSYDDVTIMDISTRAQISVGGFYARFQNKEALLNALQQKLAEETQSELTAALSQDWTAKRLSDLIDTVVAGNAALYEKYRGVLQAVHLKTRVLQDSDELNEVAKYNEVLVRQLEDLLLKKRDEINHRHPKVAIRVAVACMSSMLRDAIVFQQSALYPKPADRRTITRSVAQVMHQYLVGASS